MFSALIFHPDLFDRNIVFCKLPGYFRPLTYKLCCMLNDDSMSDDGDCQGVSDTSERTAGQWAARSFPGRRLQLQAHPRMAHTLARHVVGTTGKRDDAENKLNPASTRIVHG